MYTTTQLEYFGIVVDSENGVKNFKTMDLAEIFKQLHEWKVKKSCKKGPSCPSLVNYVNFGQMCSGGFPTNTVDFPILQ